MSNELDGSRKGTGGINEIVQLVSRDDTPCGGAIKKQIQKEGLRYRVVRVMVEDNAGRVLLQRRRLDKQLFPGRWDNSAAGHVGKGEDYKVAAVRELAEELGIRDVSLVEVGYYYSEHQDRGKKLNEWQKVFRAVVSQDICLRLQESEVAGVEWKDQQDLMPLISHQLKMVTPGLRDVIERYY